MEMEWSNAWGKGKSLSSGFAQRLILLLLGSLMLSGESFQGGKNCNRLPSFSSPFFSLPLLEGIFRYISPSHWSWPSICWSYRSLLECLSHPPPSSTCCELQQIRWYYSRVVSSLMRLDCQLRAFNAEVTAFPRIAPPSYSYSWPIGLRTSLGMLKGTTSGNVTLSLSMILVCRGQGRPRQYILEVWVPFVHPQAFLPPRHRPWAWYEMGRTPRSFGPTIAPQNPAARLLGRGGGFWCSRAYIMAG